MRGIGVAVITRISTASPLAESARRCCTPKRCCSSTTARPRSRKATLSWISAWVPTAMSMAPEARALQRTSPLGRRVAPGDQGEAHAGLERARREAGEVLAREDLGRRHHHRLAAALDDVGHGEERDQASCPSRRRPAAAAACAPALRGRRGFRPAPPAGPSREGEGQRGLYRVGLGAAGRVGATGAHAQALAHQGQRDLVGEELVVGEPLAGRGIGRDGVRRRGPVDGGQALRRRWGILLRRRRGRGTARRAVEGAAAGSISDVSPGEGCYALPIRSAAPSTALRAVPLARCAEGGFALHHSGRNGTRRERRVDRLHQHAWVESLRSVRRSAR